MLRPGRRAKPEPAEAGLSATTKDRRLPKMRFAGVSLEVTDVVKPPEPQWPDGS